MKRTYRGWRIGLVSAAALLLLVVAPGAAYAQTGYTSPYLYFRPGTTVPYYNYFLPRSNWCYAPFGFPGFRGDFITDTRFGSPFRTGRLFLAPRFSEDLVRPKTAPKTKAVW